MGIDFKELKSFLLIAEMGSISKAAQKFYISPSALAQQMDILERKLGFELFIRDHSGVRLTHVGEMFRDRIEPVLRTAKTVIDECRDASVNGKRKLCIGTYVPSPLENVYRCFASDHPETTLSFKFTDGVEYERLFDLIQSNEIDIAESENVIDLIEHRGLKFAPIYEDHLVACVAPTHELSKTGTADLSVLTGYGLCLPDKGSQAGKELIAALTSLDDKVRFVDMPSSDQAIINKCYEGYVLFMDSLYAKKFGGLKTVELDPKITMTWGVVYNRSSPAIDSFIHYAQQKMHSQPV